MSRSARVAAAHESAAPDRDIPGLEEETEAAEMMKGSAAAPAANDMGYRLSEDSAFFDVSDGQKSGWLPPLVNVTPSNEVEANNAERLPVRAHPDGREQLEFDRPARVDTLDPLSTRLGARHYRTNAIFDWCRKGQFQMRNGDGVDSRPRHTFTRFYFSSGTAGVLVDLYSHGGPAVQREVAEKALAITAHNVAAHVTIGYLPIVRGCFVSNESLDFAIAGNILPLQTDKTTLETGAA